jgi:hypothetical protein
MPRTGNAQRLARCFRKPRGVSGLGQEMPATCQTAIPRCTAGPRSCGLVYLATVQPRSTAYHARIEYTLHIAQYASSRCRDCADCLGGGGGNLQLALGGAQDVAHREGVERVPLGGDAGLDLPGRPRGPSQNCWNLQEGSGGLIGDAPAWGPERSRGRFCAQNRGRFCDSAGISVPARQCAEGKVCCEQRHPLFMTAGRDVDRGMVEIGQNGDTVGCG